jgi:PPOX class probable F420-dependent enzyme
MDETEMRRRLGEARVARLATIGPEGRPHLVPITFVLAGDEIYFAVDQKPKRTTDLQRLRNIAANPSAAVLADHYEDDWTLIWWVRADGKARVIESTEAAERAIDALVARHPQYARSRPAGPAVSIRIERLSGWAASE